MTKFMAAALLIGAITLSYAIGRRHPATEPTTHQARVLYYVDPMHPAYKSDKPGIAPDCGMQLEPVYLDSEAASTSSPPVGGAVHIDEGTQRLFGIQVAPVEKTAGKRTVRLLGRVAADDTRVYRVTSGAEGWVRQTYHDAVGAFVKKDEKLAGFFSPEFLTAESGFLAATERVPGTAMKETGRSVQNYTDRLRNLGIGDAQIARLGQTRQVSTDIDIVAPVSGFILARSISAGQRFDRGMEFYRVADLSRVWIIADVYETEAQGWRPGSVARVSTPGSSKSMTARVTDVLPQADPTSRTLKLRLEADNPGFSLRPEMFVDVELPSSLPTGLSVPADAVVDSGVRALVYVDRGDGWFESRPVETGWRSGDRIQILKGLKEGDRVVSSATFLVDSESRLRTSAAAAAVPHVQPSRASQQPLMPLGLEIDPTCGMPVDVERAMAAGQTVSYGGKTHYFCSKSCKDKFLKTTQHSAVARQENSGD